MPNFDDPFVSYYERERESLLEQLKNMQSGKWRVLDNSDDITPQCIENTKRKLAELDALAYKLAGG
jgi:hypothetical protein